LNKNTYTKTCYIGFDEVMCVGYVRLLAK